jgi:hypothetical protein
LLYENVNNFIPNNRSWMQMSLLLMRTNKHHEEIYILINSYLYIWCIR